MRDKRSDKIENKKLDMKIIIYVKRIKGINFTKARIEKSLNLIANLYFEYLASTNKQATHRQTEIQEAAKRVRDVITLLARTISRD